MPILLVKAKPNARASTLTWQEDGTGHEVHTDEPTLLVKTLLAKFDGEIPEANDEGKGGNDLAKAQVIGAEMNEAAGRGEERAGFGLLLAGQRLFAGRSKARQRFGLDFVEPEVEVLSDLEAEMLFVHSVIPFAFNAAASACVAREQWVLTLPSEQPIAEAVSATSMSSQ